MRGTISAIAPDGSYGQIAAEDGQRYSYWTSEIRNGHAQVGQAVDFKLWQGQPVDIFIQAAAAPPKAPPPQRPAAQQPMAYVAAASARAGATAPAAYADAVNSLPPANYWIALFTSPSGRISRRQFWLHGVLGIVVASIVFGMIPLLNIIVALPVLWASICICFKRFHDLGYPGWYSLLQMAPFAVELALFVVGMAIPGLLGIVWLLIKILSAVGFLIVIAQLLLVYIRVGQEGPNRYGPDPLAL
jgi:uncharacterized membrane protein YhaH (DUF805 family)